MSQIGMQMPGGLQRRGPQMNVYTGLLLAATAALAAACVVVYIYGARVAPANQGPMSLHPRDDKTGAVKTPLVLPQ